LHPAHAQDASSTKEEEGGGGGSRRKHCCPPPAFNRPVLYSRAFVDGVASLLLACTGSMGDVAIAWHFNNTDFNRQSSLACGQHPAPSLARRWSLAAACSRPPCPAIARVRSLMAWRHCSLPTPAPWATSRHTSRSLRHAASSTSSPPPCHLHLAFVASMLLAHTGSMGDVKHREGQGTRRHRCPHCVRICRPPTVVAKVTRKAKVWGATVVRIEPRNAQAGGERVRL